MKWCKKSAPLQSVKRNLVDIDGRVKSLIFWFVFFLTVLCPVHAFVTPCSYLSETCSVERCALLEERDDVETTNLCDRPLASCRIGEAQNPGPSSVPTQFTICGSKKWRWLIQWMIYKLRHQYEVFQCQILKYLMRGLLQP